MLIFADIGGIFLNITTQILATGLAHTERVITEALEIADRNPSLNRKLEQVAQTKLYIDLTEEQRKGMRKRVYE